MIKSAKMEVGERKWLLVFFLIQNIAVVPVRSQTQTVLTPTYFNVVEGKEIRATATCGEGLTTPRERYCKLTGNTADVTRPGEQEIILGQYCDYCEPANRAKAHPIQHAIDGTEKWWQSPPLSRGMDYNDVNITIDLEQGGYEFRPQFTDNSHTGCVKAVACNKKYLASGSTDETIHLYNLATNTDVGSLIQHDGAVSSLVFIGETHLVSAGHDGILYIWNTGNWDCQKVLKGHKDAVHSVAVHPSGKMALTVSSDKTLRTWNLISGRPAYTTHIKEVADRVLWSPDGSIYLVIIENVINIYDVTTATITDTIDHQVSINCVAFLERRVIAVGGEGSDIFFYNLKAARFKPVVRFPAHEKRVKDLQCCSDCSSTPDPEVRWLISASNDGFIKLWKVHLHKISAKPELLASVDTTARLTCVALQVLRRPGDDDDKDIAKQEKRKSSKKKGGSPKKKLKSDD